jgi:hypothetical protein
MKVAGAMDASEGTNYVVRSLRSANRTFEGASPEGRHPFFQHQSARPSRSRRRNGGCPGR